MINNKSQYKNSLKAAKNVFFLVLTIPLIQRKNQQKVVQDQDQDQNRQEDNSAIVETATQTINS